MNHSDNDFAARGWNLLDGEEIHRERPDTFEIPPIEARAALKPGQIVKLMFRIVLDPQKLAANPNWTVFGARPKSELTERMWVVVKRSLDDGSYVGTLDNDPASQSVARGDVRAGMEVSFDHRHVIAIHEAALQRVVSSPPRQRH